MVTTRRSQLRAAENGNGTPRGNGSAGSESDAASALGALGCDTRADWVIATPVCEPRGNGSGRAKSDGSCNLSDDDDAPDIEVASEVRVREEERDAADAALRAELKETRRKRAIALELAAKARKEKAKREDARRAQEDTLVQNVLPQDLLDRAAAAAEQQDMKANAAARELEVKSQSGFMRLVKQRRVVDGLEIVDASLPAQQRVSGKSSGKRALEFMGRCMYGNGKRRISSARAAATIKKQKTRSLRGEKESRK
jgi:hypothetical protein